MQIIESSLRRFLRKLICHALDSDEIIIERAWVITDEKENCLRLRVDHQNALNIQHTSYFEIPMDAILAFISEGW